MLGINWPKELVDPDGSIPISEGQGDINIHNVGAHLIVEARLIDERMRIIRKECSNASNM